MPELIEVEYYRKALDPIIGQRLRSVEVTPISFLRPSGTPLLVFDRFIGASVSLTRRIGKLLIVELVDKDGVVGEIGLRFGMTGRLLVDGRSPIDRLEYSSGRNDAAWDRAILRFDATVSLRDQRRLGSIEVDPDLDRLGPDATTVDTDAMTKILRGRKKTLKAVLLDQSLVAGLGNLLCDEILWRSGLSPLRPAGSLTFNEIDDLTGWIHRVIDELAARGGSHRGDSFELRGHEQTCPICATPMRHDRIATRSTWWCSGHQR